MADMADTSISTMDISKLKVPDLKRELKIRGLSTTGNKNELLERLQLALKNNDATSAEGDDFEEDLLNDDDDEHLDGNESVINDIDNVLDDSILTKRPIKRKSSESLSSEAKAGGPIKKVILNRNNSVTEDVIAEKSVVNEKQNTNESSNQNEERKVIKLSELTAKERLEMRAKKFGVTLSADAKKIARAERFGVNSPNSGSANSIKSSNVDTSVEVLKKRAERFGGSVSKTMTSLENKQKLEARKARFAGTASTNSNTTNGSTIASNEDKLKMRMERFKQAVK